MKISQNMFLRSLAAMGAVAPTLILTTPTQAQSTPAQTQNQKIQSRAAATAAAWNAAFLEQGNGQTYYNAQLVSYGEDQAKLYTGGLDIAVAEDVYQHTHSQDQRNLIIALMTTFLSDFGNGPDWSYDGYNDDIGWMTNATLRAYQYTGTPQYLTVAENNWNMAYNRGWNAALGGGIEENSSTPPSATDREALSNDPFIFTGVTLYQITGDTAYLTKAKQIYEWVRANLFNPTNSDNAQGAPGQVNQGLRDADNSLIVADHVYNEGSFITAADALYRVTGDQEYYNDALTAINHRVNLDPILHDDNECCGNQWAYWFTLGLSRFATDADLLPQYRPWLLANANAAWRERNSMNLTWNNWVGPTNDSNPDAVEMGSAVAIWQHLPPAAVKLAVDYEVQNVASDLALSVADESDASGAALVQMPFNESAPSQRWTFVPTVGGYYQIRNAGSGLVVSVAGASAINGAKVVQMPAQGMIPGNDQWEPVLNSDGTYSFYNLNSLQALDNPGESSTNGTQLDQWFGNSTTAQEFYLVPVSGQ